MRTSENKYMKSFSLSCEYAQDNDDWRLRIMGSAG